MIIFDKMPSFLEWCEATGQDPENDDVYNAYCEWKNSQ